MRPGVVTQVKRLLKPVYEAKVIQKEVYKSALEAITEAVVASGTVEAPFLPALVLQWWWMAWLSLWVGIWPRRRRASRVAARSVLQSSRTAPASMTTSARSKKVGRRASKRPRSPRVTHAVRGIRVPGAVVVMLPSHADAVSGPQRNA